MFRRYHTGLCEIILDYNGSCSGRFYEIMQDYSPDDFSPAAGGRGLRDDRQMTQRSRSSADPCAAWGSGALISKHCVNLAGRLL